MSRRSATRVVIVVPESDQHDPTRASPVYDPTYFYLKVRGIREIG